MSMFFGLETARRALMAQQQALNITNHNIANANTPGFSRQEALFVTTPPYTLGQSLAGKAQEMGTGVKVAEIRRLRERFLDHQFRTEVKDLGRWQVRSDLYHRLELIMHEPGEGGLAGALGAFWHGWQKLAENPENSTARSVLLQQAIDLTDTLNHLDRQLKQLGDDCNQILAIRVAEINTLARQIAALNQQIVRVEAGSQQANDLRDQRDLLVDQLAELAGIQVLEKESGAIDVVLGNRGLVEGVNVSQLTVAGDPLGLHRVPAWFDGQPLKVNGGVLLGIEEAYSCLVQFQDHLNEMVQVMATEVNKLHLAGYGLDGGNGRQFFVTTDGEAKFDLGNIIVNPELAADPGLIAAATDPAQLPGDGGTALEIGRLKHNPVGGDNSSITEYYNGIIAQLGISAQEAYGMVANQEILTGAIDNRRQAVSGVSLDEEMVNMVRYQHAYNAAARMVTAIDEMLEVVVNRLGVVGR
ncbi:MAG: flagellar hook-associated protein FlgK [bacterium]|jgi:flagellar hook-associated protein 1 FlgK